MILMSVRRSSLRRYAPGTATLRYLPSPGTTRLSMAQEDRFSWHAATFQGTPDATPVDWLKTAHMPAGATPPGHFLADSGHGSTGARIASLFYLGFPAREGFRTAGEGFAQGLRR